MPSAAVPVRLPKLPMRASRWTGNDYHHIAFNWLIAGSARCARVNNALTDFRGTRPVKAALRTARDRESRDYSESDMN